MRIAVRADRPSCTYCRAAVVVPHRPRRRVFSIKPCCLKSSVAPPLRILYGLKRCSTLKKESNCRKALRNISGLCCQSLCPSGASWCCSKKALIISRGTSSYNTMFSSTARLSPVLVLPSCTTTVCRPRRTCWISSFSNSPVRNIPQKPRMRRTLMVKSSSSTHRPSKPRKTRIGSGGACAGFSTRLHTLNNLQARTNLPLQNGAKCWSPQSVSLTCVIPSPAEYCSSIQPTRAASHESSVASNRGRIFLTASKYLFLVLQVILLSSNAVSPLLLRRSALSCSPRTFISRVICTFYVS